MEDPFFTPVIFRFNSAGRKGPDKELGAPVNSLESLTQNTLTIQLFPPRLPLLCFLLTALSFGFFLSSLSTKCVVSLVSFGLFPPLLILFTSLHLNLVSFLSSLLYFLFFFLSPLSSLLLSWFTHTSITLLLFCHFQTSVSFSRRETQLMWSNCLFHFCRHTNKHTEEKGHFHYSLFFFFLNDSVISLSTSFHSSVFVQRTCF